MRIKEVEAKSILNKSGITDYCINCYTGCSFGCSYCYAPLIVRRFFSGGKWGSFVSAKMNAPELLRKQLQKAKPGSIMISSVCDPYQYAEKKYELTRRCLAEILDCKKKFGISILTKSSLVIRDIDLFRQFDDIEVGLTVTTDNDKMRKTFEPNAPSIGERLQALRQLKESGIRTYAFIGPILKMDATLLAEKIAKYVSYVFIDRLNYAARINSILKENNMEFIADVKYTSEKVNELIKELKERGIKSKTLF